MNKLQREFKYLLFLFFIGILIQSCFRDDTEYQKALKDDSMIKADQIANRIQVVFFDSTWTKAVLRADRAEIYNAENRTELKGAVKVEYFSKKTGNRLSVLTCQEATVDDNTKNMIARGNVVVVSDSAGVQLQTSTLNWNNQRQIVYTNEFITISTKKEIIRGYGFESNLDLSNYKIYKVSGIQQ